jgi:hypothetical protein
MALMRLLVRVLLALLPWLVFVVAINVVFQPADAAQFVFAAHWLLIPFLPVYALVLIVGFRCTRPLPQ